MSRFLTRMPLLLVVFVMVFSLAFIGCGGNNGGNAEKEKAEGSSVQSAQKVELTLRHQDVGETQKSAADSTEDAVARFTRDNPNVSVKIDILDQDTHRQKLKAEMAGGIPPDLFFTWGYAESEPYYKAGKLMDLTETLNSDAQWKDGFVPGILDAFHYGDGYYGIPRSGFVEGLFYNKEIFKKIGIEPPKTLDELKTVILKCKEAGYIPIALGNKEKWPSTFIHNFFFERQLGYDYFEKLLARESGYTWENEDYIKANEKVQDLVNMGAFPEGLNSISRDEGTALFYQEKAAMFIDGSWMCTIFSSDQAPDGFIDKIGFVNFPAFSDGKGDQNTIIAGFTAGFSINADLKDAKKDAALKLIKYLNDDKMAEYQFYNCKQIPNRKIENMDEQKVGSLFIETVNVLESSTAKLLPHTDVMPSGLMNVYYDVSQGIFDLSMTPQQGMKKMEEASDEYLTK
jgi:raffinose/stachyose/melibiose transport system substrate-binding protein